MDARTYILELSEKIDLQKEALETALPMAEMLWETEEPETIWKEMQTEYGMAVVARHAKAHGCEENLFALSVTLLLTRNMLSIYEKEKYPLSVYYDSLKDIPIWAQCCFEETGRWGMKQFGWLCGTLKGKLWRLGRMQFERITFEEECYEGNGIVLRKGDMLLNTHIPQGEPLTPALRQDAFDRAVDFFGSNVFMCESWMLWPEHRNMLKPTSNIISFMDDFDIFKSEEYPGVADLWRIFGYLPSYEPQKLPGNTSMRRAYRQKLLENGGLTGCGWGIHVHKS